MARVKITNIKNVSNNIRREFDKIRRDPELLLDIGDSLVVQIAGINQAGRSPSGKSHSKLSKSWIKQRSKLMRYNSADPLFLNSSQSNVTFTGRLINSIKKYKIKQSDALVIIEPDGEHPGYKTKKGNTDKVSFKKLLTYLADQGRVIVFINEAMKRRVNVVVKSFIRRKIIKSKF